MFHQIGLNHIFDDGKFCFCLVCKDTITENYPLDSDKAVFQHFRSEDHEKSVRELFKVCVPDPKCESRDIKYLDIVNNSYFNVFEQGYEPSYVSKRGNLFMCLICKEEVSKVYEETYKTKHNLQHHLGSELHIDNVKDSIWWTYHPNLDANYIALNTVFMYCSFCKKLLLSKENSLLEFAADHIETELIQRISDGASKKSLEEINTNYHSITESQETIIDDASNTEYIEKIKTKKSLESIIYSYNKVNTATVAGDNINLNQVTVEFKEAEKSLHYNEGLDSSLAWETLMEEPAICTECNEQVEVYNNDVQFSLLKHSQIHKDPVLFESDNECEIQKEVSNLCLLCHEQYEIFNKDKVFSYKYHFENCHPDSGNPLVTIENASNDYIRGQELHEESEIITKAFYLLPKCLRDHLSFVTCVGESLKCLLCNCELCFSNDITVVCGVLRNHFLQFYHKSQYELCVQQDTYDEENVQLFKGLQFNRSTMSNETVSPGKLVQKTVERISTNNKTLELPLGKVRNRFEVKGMLFRLIDGHPVVEKNKVYLDEKSGHFYCNLCDEIISCTHEGAELVKHLKGDFHLNKSKYDETNSQPRGKVRTRAEVLSLLTELSRCNKTINKNIDDIGEKGGRFFCKCCNEIIMCTLSGKKLVNHLHGAYHREHKQRLAEKLRLNARPAEQVYNVLWQLARNKIEVNENIDVLREKQGHFYCELCNEIIMCTLGGEKLVDHLHGPYHGEQKKRLAEELRLKACPAQQVYDILCQLACKKREVSENIEILVESQGHFYCILCNEVVPCTISGSKLIEHLKDQKHLSNPFRFTSNNLLK